MESYILSKLKPSSKRSDVRLFEDFTTCLHHPDFNVLLTTNWFTPDDIERILMLARRHAPPITAQDPTSTADNHPQTISDTPTTTTQGLLAGQATASFDVGFDDTNTSIPLDSDLECTGQRPLTHRRRKRSDSSSDHEAFPVPISSSRKRIRPAATHHHSSGNDQDQDSPAIHQPRKRRGRPKGPKVEGQPDTFPSQTPWSYVRFQMSKIDEVDPTLMRFLQGGNDNVEVKAMEFLSEFNHHHPAVHDFGAFCKEVKEMANDTPLKQVYRLLLLLEVQDRADDLNSRQLKEWKRDGVVEKLLEISGEVDWVCDELGIGSILWLHRSFSDQFFRKVIHKGDPYEDAMAKLDKLGFHEHIGKTTANQFLRAVRKKLHGDVHAGGRGEVSGAAHGEAKRGNVGVSDVGQGEAGNAGVSNVVHGGAEQEGNAGVADVVHGEAEKEKHAGVADAVHGEAEQASNAGLADVVHGEAEKSGNGEVENEGHGEIRDDGHSIVHEDEQNRDQGP
ncbi:MAG: hypothetical protein Q9169_006617 [Polycauliona sp. 2 TL-2023]